MKKLIKDSELREVEVSYKRKHLSEMTQINGSDAVAEVLKELWSEKIDYCEEFLILLITRSNHIQGWVKISSGGVSGTVADPKLIFQAALNTNSSSIILAHNHPSGALKPSESDKALTKKLVSGGKLLDIAILDHIIVTSEGHYSFADNGLI